MLLTVATAIVLSRKPGCFVIEIEFPRFKIKNNRVGYERRGSSSKGQVSQFTYNQWTKYARRVALV